MGIKKTNLKNLINYKFKKYFVLLIVVFLFSKVKAESLDSAFVNLSNLYVQDSVNRDYQIAFNLYKNNNYIESAEIAYSLLKSKDQILKIKTYSLLGKILEKSNDVKNALNHFRRSQFIIDNYLKRGADIIYEENKLPLDIEQIEAENLRYLGKLYGIENKIDSSYYYLEKLINIRSLDPKVLYSIGNGFNNLSIIKFKKKKYEEAKSYLSKAIEIFEKTNRKKALSMSYTNLANIYEVTNQRKKALETYFKALSFIEDKNNSESLDYKEALYYNIAWTMYNLKDYKAYEYLEKSYDLKDSLININLRKELKKIEQTHNIDLIRKEAENKRLSLVRNNWFIGIIGALVSLLLLYLVNLNKLKKKDLELQLSLKEYEQQKKIDDLQLEVQTKIINATIDGKETERKQIAETLHDNVSALLSSANLHLQASEKHFGKKPPVELEKTKQIITEASQKIRDLSHNLVSSVLLKFGLEYAIKDTAKKYSNSTIKIHTAIGDLNRYAQDFEIRVYNIIQELINNILKHSKASTAFIAMEECDEKLLVIVKDTGVGFKKKNEEETGIGLTQIEARVRIMDGVFHIETKENEGTKITLEIPIVERKVIMSV